MNKYILSLDQGTTSSRTIAAFPNKIPPICFYNILQLRYCKYKEIRVANFDMIKNYHKSFIKLYFTEKIY